MIVHSNLSNLLEVALIFWLIIALVAINDRYEKNNKQIMFDEIESCVLATFDISISTLLIIIGLSYADKLGEAREIVQIPMILSSVMTLARGLKKLNCNHNQCVANNVQQPSKIRVPSALIIGLLVGLSIAGVYINKTNEEIKGISERLGKAIESNVVQAKLAAITRQELEKLKTSIKKH